MPFSSRNRKFERLGDSLHEIVKWPFLYTKKRKGHNTTTYRDIKKSFSYESLGTVIMQDQGGSSINYIITARKRCLRRLCFYRCLSVHRGEGACVVAGGACVVARGHAWLWGSCMVAGGMHGCQGACMVVGGGYVWLAGGMCGCGGHAWLLGGMHGCWGCAWLWGGMHGCRGVCVVAWGGVCIGYNEIRSMSGQYASYWNAFLFTSCG